MWLIVLRVAIAPALIAGGSAAQRRWGQAIGGRIIGLPLTALPLLMLLALAQGRAFAATAAGANLEAGVAQSAWCLAYVLAARMWRPLTSLAVATATFAATCMVIYHLPLPPLVSAALSAAGVFAALAVWPHARGPERPATTGRYELPARMVAGAAFTLMVCESAAMLGARAAGLVGALPVLTVVLTVASHRRDGATAANQFLEGVMRGSLSVVAAVAVIALVLPTHGALVAFPLALVAALAGQMIPTERLGRVHAAAA
jgi:hypothetical protein